MAFKREWISTEIAYAEILRNSTLQTMVPPIPHLFVKSPYGISVWIEALPNIPSIVRHSVLPLDGVHWVCPSTTVGRENRQAGKGRTYVLSLVSKWLSGAKVHSVRLHDCTVVAANPKF